jgi:hypothetical protein
MKMGFLSKPLVKLPIVGKVTPLLLGVAFAGWYFFIKKPAAAAPTVAGFGFSNYFRG